MMQKKFSISEMKQPGENVTVMVKILSLNQRIIKNEKGETLYYYGLVGDNTGSMPFTAWAFPSGIKVGDVVEIRKASLKEYKGSLRMYLDSRSEVILHPEETMDVKPSYQMLKISEIKPSIRYVSLKAAAMGVSQRELDRDGQKTTMYSGRLADDTGSIRFSSFGVPVQDGDHLMIEGAQVREYKGNLQITINEKTKVSRVSLDFQPGAHTKNISELNGPIGGVEIFAISVSLGEKSGLVYRCSECRNKLDDIRCPDHPDAAVAYDLFAYFLVDDGTGSILCTAGSSALLKLIGMRPDELVPSNRSVTGRSIAESLRNNIVGKALVIRGDIVSGTGGLSIRGSEIFHPAQEDLNRLTQFLEADFS
ncbi:MAG: replication protein A [Thermoplasmataceae archaeon]